MEKYMKENIEMRYKKESIIMNLELDELHVISESLDLLKNEFGTEITVGKINIQDILDRIHNAIDKIESEELRECLNRVCELVRESYVRFYRSI